VQLSKHLMRKGLEAESARQLVAAATRSAREPWERRGSVLLPPHQWLRPTAELGPDFIRN